MPTISRTLRISAMLVLGGLVAAAVAPAEAAPHRHKMMKMKTKGTPAQLKAGYVGAPGYAGGAPGRGAPALFDQPAPMGILKGFPVIGNIGL